ncbi:UV-endonuclease UvdE [Paraphaeosphaeria sporulosa]|uniref:UV-endonuclease UvdE n=1 Tax=Paraphaeosphaeria sporulosa TaxID=1460663 RepID=A0A177CJS0_9PLEO|nr:UV-endonuclease UvdE [Paraphaeosphaeria sporulosa]OAG07089.1 UV-endonuclease UvdE [Paraphaeosphaeria sporulosa]
MARRRQSSGVAAATTSSSDGPSRSRQQTKVPFPANVAHLHDAEPHPTPAPARRQSSRNISSHASTNPNTNPDVVDGITALRASPDNVELASIADDLKPDREIPRQPTDATPAAPNALTEHSSIDVPAEAHGQSRGARSRRPKNGSAPAPETAAAGVPEQPPGKNKRKRGANAKEHVKVDSAAANGTTDAGSTTATTASSGPAVEKDVGVTVDPEADEDAAESEDEIKEALSRPPPVNSDYLPLPWKGRIGYACLNTYLRNANPPVFSSRTCRIASILEHRHPLKDPSQPEHATKNRPARDQPADVARGQRYVEEFGLANARDVIKMVRWNDKYGIKFMRLSSEMFPFASHDEYGYKLTPFAADTLAEAGKVIAELGHRVTTHPGQFTQLGSPRKQVIDNAIRDLAYHDEMLSLLKLPPQEDRDAVMILHLGGAYGDKPAAIERFKENYSQLPQSVKNRLVLENDDVVWSVHEILPLCEELNIPMVLDFHHHNILFDSTQIREGTKDIVDLFPRILETWKKKNITPKMHYSEPCPEAVTARTRRKHSPRVMTLPPCPDTMDLMIEAKDKEQAVFELMRTFKLPGFDFFNDVIPHVRQDENRPWKPKPKKAAKKSKKKAEGLEELDAKVEEEAEEKPPPVVPEEEVGMGGPDRRVYWPPGMEDWLRPVKRIIKKKDDADGAATPAKKKRKTAAGAANTDDVPSINGDTSAEKKRSVKKPAPKRATTKQKGPGKTIPAPSPSDEGSDPLSSLGEDDDGDEGGGAPPNKRAAPAPARKRSGRVSQRVSYKEEEADD